MATTKAWVLIETALGKPHDAVGALQNAPGVSSVMVHRTLRRHFRPGGSRPEFRGRYRHSVRAYHRGIVRTDTCLAVGGSR
jgi:hypothetical protein